ncbi:putative phage baseplate assembly protein [Archangium gephyra]|uniref:Phage baseplate assembly protein n=1 Tax=Archangium gephyra TaxID=48 RepID=A0AAC8TEI5_9BACT|nr:baseplate J/gp47 family protein [Archangium gephyra]AKJ02892.1 Hypothetical protein AA314_04518 [Archangium gephyra]REG25018.1 putative phage baseplate assembly protein [Archangium gephyra]
MPLTSPNLDDRRYQDLLDEALARIPVHNPEWTNFNRSDPGITLIELFAFLTENLLFRANQIPERNRKKFLSLLGIPLQPATSAKGLVAFTLERGPLRALTLTEGVELRAGQVPFRTTRGLDVLPIETQAFYKRQVSPDPKVRAYYDELYASFKSKPPDAELRLYATTPFSPRGTEPVDLGAQAVDRSLWVALMLRETDTPRGTETWQDKRKEAREALLGKTLSLGLVPAVDEQGRRLVPVGPARDEELVVLQFQLPALPPGGVLPGVPGERNASYRTLSTLELPDEPVVADITLPSSLEQLELWSNLDPLEAGSRDFPPALDNEEQEQRVLTWLRITSPAPARLSLLWAGTNIAEVSQRTRVLGEQLSPGTGEPDQQVKLSRTPVLPDTVRLTVTHNGRSEPWEELDELMNAGPEVSVRDPRLPPGTTPLRNPRVKVFTVDPEAGVLRFGDGVHGARPPLGAELRVDYDQGLGLAGNVGPDSITTGPSLPAGLKVTNPLPTWGGADAETVREGEKQITRHLQHRDRLVSVRDFETLTLRTPGVAVGRVDVLPAFHPLLPSQEPGDAAGAVTLLVIPSNEPEPPPVSGPDPFLDAIACWLAPRRLVTTELFIRRPVYKDIWVSIGIDVVAGMAVATVREAVKQALRDFLSPLPPADVEPLEDETRKGWPLRKAVVALELVAVASRVPGVAWVTKVRLGLGDGVERDSIPMQGLELPRLVGLSVGIGLGQGEAPPLEELQGTTAPVSERPFMPVPIVPEECA